MRPLIERCHHRLEIACGPGPLRVEADPTRLEQILVNLLSNAAKYTSPGGRIVVSTVHDGSQVLIRVADNGIGIPPEKLPSMFELFTQGDRSLARTEGGLGIGLTLVKRLTEFHGGSVTARSDGKGLGSEFVVRFPSAAQSGPEEREPAALPPAWTNQPKHILVVDDQPDAAWALSKLLERLGHEVQVAHDGPEALTLANRQTPDCILLDIGLPGIDGYDVAWELRKKDDFKKTVIIAISGYGQEEDRRKSLAAGFDHHLVKPVDHEELLSLVGRAGLDRPDRDRREAAAHF